MRQIAFETVISFARPSGSGRFGFGAAKLRTSAIASLALALASWKACKYMLVVVAIYTYFFADEAFENIVNYGETEE